LLQPLLLPMLLLLLVVVAYLASLDAEVTEVQLVLLQQLPLEGIEVVEGGVVHKRVSEAAQGPAGSTAGTKHTAHAHMPDVGDNILTNELLLWAAWYAPPAALHSVNTIG
jgi:hypothetical protein